MIMITFVEFSFDKSFSGCVGQPICLFKNLFDVATEVANKHG